MTNTTKRSRRKFKAEFKAKVAMEALQEKLTLSELSKKHGVHPNLITKWKNQLKEQSTSVFQERGEAGSDDKDKYNAP
jgi:transposase-like protein